MKNDEVFPSCLSNRSRQHVIRKPTVEWIEQHYAGIFKEVHFGNHFALEGKARPKSEICRCVCFFSYRGPVSELLSVRFFIQVLHHNMIRV